MYVHRCPRKPISRRGVAAVELALLLPLICFLFVITVDFARVFYFDLTVANCARNGGIYAFRDPNHALDSAGIQAAAQMDAGNLDPKLMTVSSTTDSPTTPTLVTVTVTYPFTTITSYPGVPSSMTLSRSLRMNVAPLQVN
jgi:Flp pilus assembly protein TadG